MNQQVLTNKNPLCSFMFLERDEETYNWSTGHGYNYKGRDIYLVLLNWKNTQHYWFFWFRENLFTRIEATPYFAIR